MTLNSRVPWAWQEKLNVRHAAGSSKLIRVHWIAGQGSLAQFGANRLNSGRFLIIKGGWRHQKSLDHSELLLNFEALKLLVDVSD